MKIGLILLLSVSLITGCTTTSNHPQADNGPLINPLRGKILEVQMMSGALATKDAVHEFVARVDTAKAGSTLTNCFLAGGLAFDPATHRFNLQFGELICQNTDAWLPLSNTQAQIIDLDMKNGINTSFIKLGEKELEHGNIIPGREMYLRIN